MDNSDRLLRLHPAVEFGPAEDGRILVSVTRGESTTRYTVNQAIREFLECFREPHTLSQAALRLSAEGYEFAQVIKLGEKIVKTPMLEFCDANDDDIAADGVIESLGYRVVTKLKERKFDGVYRVRDADGDLRVLKLLHSRDDGRNGAAIRKRLRNEYDILRLLGDVDGVVDPDRYDAGRGDYFTMAHVEGTPLLDRKYESLDMAIVQCRRVAEIVGQVHGRGVIHGDIHTSNFLRTPRGDITLIDFDCAFVHGGGYVPRVGGAVHFMPPERVVKSWHDKSMKKPDFRSDIYQSAVVMYALLTEDLPYRGATLSELSKNIASGKFRPLRNARCGTAISEVIVDAIHGALDPNPAQRPYDMKELSHVLAPH